MVITTATTASAKVISTLDDKSQQPHPQPIRSLAEMPRECKCLLSHEMVRARFGAARNLLKDVPQPQLKPALEIKYPISEGFEEFFVGTLGLDSFVINGTIVSDVIIFKVNSENIFYNLADAESPQRLVREHTWKQKTITYTSAQPRDFEKKRSKPPYRGAVAGPYTFAFVRDPLQHLISGIVESHFRNLGLEEAAYPNISSPEFKQHAEGHYATVSTAREVVTALALASPRYLQPYLSAPKHLLRMTYPLLLWKPNFVGQLEHFNEHWDDMMRRMGLRIDYEVKDIYHPTTDDPLNMHRSLNELLASEPTYLRALCTLLSIDYYCLKYPLPKGCEDLFDGPDWKKYSKRCTPS